MDRITKRLDQMRESLKDLYRQNAIGNDLFADLDYLDEKIHDLEYVFDEIENERDEAQKRVEELEKAEAQRKDDEFRNILVAAAQGPSAPGHGDPVGPVWAQAPDDIDDSPPLEDK